MQQLPKQQRGTHRKQELLDLLHGVGHAQVGLGHGGEHLDEHVQLQGQVGVFGLAGFPQPLLLKPDNITSESERQSSEVK